MILDGVHSEYNGVHRYTKNINGEIRSGKRFEVVLLFVWKGS